MQLISPVVLIVYVFIQLLFCASAHAKGANQADNLQKLILEGKAFRTQGGISQSIALLQQAVRLRPDSWEAHLELARSF